ncbi:MAG: hypothetical protein K2H20_00270 [Bacilli bacterium]|nr:hypothetical protein [Bacilli bacterium]
MNSYTAQDVIICEDKDGDWILSDFGNGTVADLTAPNEVSNTNTGYNGNSLAAHNEPGRQRECTLRIVKGSSDDKRLKKNYNLWKNRDLRFKPLNMTFTKTLGHGDGTLTQDTTECYFGIPAGTPGKQMNTEGDTEQLVSVYMIRFGNSEDIS